MLMNVLVCVFLFLFIGLFKYVSSVEIKEVGRKVLFVNRLVLFECLFVKECLIFVF